MQASKQLAPVPPGAANRGGLGLGGLIRGFLIGIVLITQASVALDWGQHSGGLGSGGLGFGAQGSVHRSLPGRVATRGPVIGLDARNGRGAAAHLARGSDFDQLRELLEARGIRLRAVAEFTPEHLSGLDALVLRQPVTVDQRFTMREREAILNLVAGGAALLVHGDLEGPRAPRKNLNQLLRPLGVAFGSAQDGGVVPSRQRRVWRVESLVAHPVTRGLSAIQIDFPRRVVALHPPAQGLTRHSGPNDVMVAVDRPVAGRVVVLGDASVWADPEVNAVAGLAAPGNRVLLLNVLEFLLRRPLPVILPALGEPVQTPGLQVQLADLRDAWLGLPSQASAVLRLLIPEGAGSGCYIDLALSGAKPGALLMILLGEPREGGTLSNPHLLETVVADAQGRVTASVLVPASAAGHVFGLRLLDPVTGETSPVMQFEPHR